MVKKNSQMSKEEEVTKETKIPTIKVKALWKGFSPDCRPYKPSTPVIEFAPEPLVIVVEVPMTSDLILNCDVIASAQLTNQSEPKPQFTPLGMRYIIDQFEAAMKNGEPDAEETAKSDDEDWDDESVKSKVKDDPETPMQPKNMDDDEWEDEEETSEGEEDKPWEEDWNE